MFLQERNGFTFAFVNGWVVVITNMSGRDEIRYISAHVQKPDGTETNKGYYSANDLAELMNRVSREQSDHA